MEDPTLQVAANLLPEGTADRLQGDMGDQHRQAGVDRLLEGMEGQSCEVGVDHLPGDMAEHLLGSMEDPYLQVGADRLPEGMAGRLDQLIEDHLQGDMSMNLRLLGADHPLGNLDICRHLQEVGHRTEGTEGQFPQAGAGLPPKGPCTHP
mmetsp:Transcript_898/g.3483  ORF Transcript_898/g.3483 Transcript_898/m.3483 type:complete len:150 (+) Transcript_898:248-697(+)